MDKRQNNKKNNKNKHNKHKENGQKQRLINPDAEPVKLLNHHRRELKDLAVQLLRTCHTEVNNAKEEWDQYITLQAILKRVQVIEAPLPKKAPSPTKNRVASFDAFYAWAKEQGIQYDGLEIDEFPGYDLGLKATRDIKKDETLFSIPRKLALSEENPDYAFAKDFFKLSNLKLAFILMIEAMKPQSFWKPYIDLLPDSYNTVLYFSVEEMAQLKGSNALSAALRQCRLIARLYAVIYQWPSSEIPFGDFKDIFNYDLYRWAVSTVMTRENLIPRSRPQQQNDGYGSDTIAALIPFWDMANHRDGVITTFFNGETNQVESSAQDDVKQGEQIFIYYGDRSNADLMIHNGFLNPTNAKDFVAIKLGLSPSDPLFVKRAQLLDHLGIPKNGELKVLAAPNYITSGLLAFVRIFNMNAEQLDHWIASDRAADLLHIDCALETALDSKTWQYLQTRLMLLLRVFPDTLEADEKRLAETKQLQLSAIGEMVLQYRVLEKRILTAALDYAKQRTKA